MANAALSFVVVVWISGMLFGWLIEAKQLTILKGISNFFFLLYHLWYVYAFFTYAQVKYLLGFPLIMINILIFFFWKEVLYLLTEIYIYIYMCVCVCQGAYNWIGTPHTQSVLGLREKMFKLWESRRKGSSFEVSIDTVIISKKKKRDIYIYIVFLKLK